MLALAADPAHTILSHASAPLIPGMLVSATRFTLAAPAEHNSWYIASLTPSHPAG